MTTDPGQLAEATSARIWAEVCTRTDEPTAWNERREQQMAAIEVDDEMSTASLRLVTGTRTIRTGWRR